MYSRNGYFQMPIEMCSTSIGPDALPWLNIYYWLACNT